MWVAKALAALSLAVAPVQFSYTPDDPFRALSQGRPVEGPPDACPQTHGTPEVSVKVDRVEPTYSRSENIQSLTAQSTDAYHPEGTTGPAWHTQGLTRSSFEYDWEGPIMVLSLPNGLYCIQLQRIDVTITLRPQVWVANEFAPGSCMYNAVKGHEQKHVAVDTEVTNRHRAMIENAVRQMSFERAVFGPASKDIVTREYNELRQQMTDVINDEIKSLQDDDARMQRGVDTLQEYQRVAHLCPGQQ